MAHKEEGGQDGDDAAAARHDRRRRADQRAEDQRQRDQRQRERHDLAAAQVGGARPLDVGVEDRPAGDHRAQLRRGGPQLRLDLRQEPLRALGRRVEDDQGVGRVAIGGHLPRVGGVGHHLGDLGRLADVAQGVRRRRREARVVGGPVLGGEDHREARGFEVEVPLERDERARRLHRVAGEAADLEDTGDARRQREARQDQDRPQRDDQPAPSVDGATELHERHDRLLYGRV